MAATYVISGLALEKEILQRLLRREIMKESVTYQEILREGLAEGKAVGMAEGKAVGMVEGKAVGMVEGKAVGMVEGKAEGRAEGKAEAANQIALNMLRSGISVDLIAQFTGLSLEQIEKLSP